MRGAPCLLFLPLWPFLLAPPPIVVALRHGVVIMARRRPPNICGPLRFRLVRLVVLLAIIPPMGSASRLWSDTVWGPGAPAGPGRNRLGVCAGVRRFLAFGRFRGQLMFTCCAPIGGGASVAIFPCTSPPLRQGRSTATSSPQHPPPPPIHSGFSRPLDQSRCSSFEMARFLRMGGVSFVCVGAGVPLVVSQFLLSFAELCLGWAGPSRLFRRCRLFRHRRPRCCSEPY